LRRKKLLLLKMPKRMKMRSRMKVKLSLRLMKKAKRPRL